MRASGLIWVYALSIGLGFLATSTFAGEGCCQAKLGVAIQKVDLVLADWKAHQTAVGNGCQKTRTAKQAARLELASSRPIGSRMDEALRFVNESLAEALKAEGICAEACKARGGVKDERAMALVAKRSELLKKLHELSGYTQLTGATQTETAKSFCPDKAQKLATEIRKTECNNSAAKLLVAAVPGLQCEKKAAGIVASIKGAGCEKSAAKVVLATAADLAPTTQAPTAQPCAIQSKFSSKAVLVMASLDAGAATYGKMCANSRGALAAKFEALAKTDRTVALIPPTLMTLGEGLAALTELDARMAEYAQSKPELTAGLTAESMAAYARSVSLISGAHDVLKKVHNVMLAGTEAKAEGTTGD